MTPQFLHVPDEIEHLLDDNEDMAKLYLTREWLQNQQFEAHLNVITSHNLSNTASAFLKSVLTETW